MFNGRLTAHEPRQTLADSYVAWGTYLEYRLRSMPGTVVHAKLIDGLRANFAALDRDGNGYIEWKDIEAAEDVSSTRTACAGCHTPTRARATTGSEVAHGTPDRLCAGRSTGISSMATPAGTPLPTPRPENTRGSG